MTYDTGVFNSIKSSFRNDFEELKQDYINRENTKAESIKRNLGINTFNIHLMYYYYDNEFDNRRGAVLAWKEYKDLMNLVILECKNSGIDYEKDSKVIIKKAIDILSMHPTISNKLAVTDISDCYSYESVNEHFNSYIAKANTKKEYEFISMKYQNKKFELTRYTGEFFDNQYLLFNALSDDKYKNRAQILKNYAEFLIAFPEYCRILAGVSNCSDKASKLKFDMALSEFYSNSEFIADLDNIMIHDSNKERYHYHVTQGEKEAKKILNEGLFMFTSNVDDNSYEEVSQKGILTYEYGNTFERFSDYIIVFSNPVGQNIARKLSEDERTKCNIFPRRIGALARKPSYVIDREHIVGYIDKEHCKVVLNECYEKFDNKQRKR